MNANAAYASMIEICEDEIDGFEIRYKNEHRLQALIGFIFRWVIPINRKYMENYTTTIYPFVYFPSREWVEANRYHAFEVLAHEYVHLYDERRVGHAWYKFSYLAPQILSLISLFALAAFFWKPALWALVTLIFLAPISAPWRRLYERRGYLMGMALKYWRDGVVRDSFVEHVAEKFTGFDYYLMWPFKKSVYRKIQEDIGRIERGDILAGPGSQPYRDVYNLFNEVRGIAA